jgi:F-box and leucine-rich repeat protein 2/20
VSDEALATLASCCKQIELLHVSMCHAITDTGLYSFAMNANPKPFRSLDVSYCRSLCDDSIEVVAKKLVHITYLSLRGCSRVTDLSAKAVTHNLWQLTDLDFEDLFLITDDCFFFDHENDGRRAADAQMLTNIINLNVSECNGLTDRAIGGIATRCSKLRSFHGAGLQLLTSAGFELFVREPTALAPRGQFLHVINLSFVPSLSDESLSVIAEACPLLETVNLAGCVLLSDAGVLSLASKCGHVKKLGLSHMKRVTDASICSCADYLWLEDLDISGCSKITDDGIEVLCLEFAGLVRLDISSCSKLTNASLDSIMRHADYLRYVYYLYLPSLSSLHMCPPSYQT